MRIFYKAIKTKILEYCLDVLFDKILINFHVKPPTIKVGEYYWDLNSRQI